MSESQGNFYMDEASSHHERGDFRQARESATRAFDNYYEANIVNGQAHALTLQYQACQGLRDEEGKSTCISKAIAVQALAETLPVDSDDKAEAYGKLGMFFDLSDNLELAEGLLRQADHLNEIVGDPRRQAAVLNHIGIVCGQRCFQYGDPTGLDRAIHAFNRALEINTNLGRLDMADANRKNIEKLKDDYKSRNRI